MTRLSHDSPAVGQPRLRPAVSDLALADETALIADFLQQPLFSAAARERIERHATGLVTAVRARGRARRGVEAFLREYDLSSEEGVVLMCLAEALLRIPDAETADRLIRDRVSLGDWERHLGRSESWLVNAATWGLMLTGRMVRVDPRTSDAPRGVLRRLGRHGEPLIRTALREALRILGRQFVMGARIDEAVTRVRREFQGPQRCSFDMLGEAAVTAGDAERFFQAYTGAIERLAAESTPGAAVADSPGVSVKLSALHPRFEYAQYQRVMDELVPRLRDLALRARAAGVGLTVDAEEADRLDLTLDVFEAVYRDAAFDAWDGLGLAVQAYQKRAVAVIEWLATLAREVGRRIPVRLVKGAYWDTEIKRAQERGLREFPVFTRKPATDVSYLHCAQRLLQAVDVLYAQFATHNAHTVAAVLHLAGESRRFEFQRLHGMGEDLYAVLAEAHPTVGCRVYAPVGPHSQLLPYLVRRLLENGANTSFVHRIDDPAVEVLSLVRDPAQQLRAAPSLRHPGIALPIDLFEPLRRNSKGVDLSEPRALQQFEQELRQAAQAHYRAAPRIDGDSAHGEPVAVRSPSDHGLQVGEVIAAGADQVRQACAAARRGFAAWSVRPVAERARVLERAADRLEAQRGALVHLIVHEGGRCIPDALAEVREAADFCRYYAVCARALAEQALPGPVGERNVLGLHGRGVFACISPWNFPVAIFTGQIAAALVVGNAVVAKPAQQTTLCAMQVVHLLHEAGVPPEVLQFLPGGSATVGAPLLEDPDLAGVAFTGSTATGHTINRTLAGRDGPILPLVAETGGQNAMIVDSSALTEQVVRDAVHSAFNSAGQRCSALRVLFVQEEVADRLADGLQGAMQELQVGDPARLSTDVGPVIDDRARQTLAAHRATLGDCVRYAVPLSGACASGSFVAPTLFEIERMSVLKGEVFGPMLHLVRYRAEALDRVVDAINASGFGLTLGIHSRIEATARRVIERARVGNIYVNRNMVGAVVGAQPFGGEGLSGTGPKAGGPHYLLRFAHERVVSTNTAAIGGNATLLSMEGDG